VNLFGYTADEIARMKNHFTVLVHPEDLPRLRDNIARLKRLEDGETIEFECRVRRRDGEWRWVVARSTIFARDENGEPRQIINATLDITEHKRLEEALQASEERFRRYFDLGLIGMAIMSPSKGMMEVNDHLCEILRYERNELLQRTWAELTHPDDLAADVANFNAVMAGEIDGYSVDKRFIRKDGNVIHTIVSVKCLRRADMSVDYFVALLQDITARKRAEEALAQAAEAAKKDQELKSAFLDALAHEIKTPLAAAKMAVTTLLADGGQMTTEQRRELLGVIDRTADRLNAWSSETIRAASIEAGTIALTKVRRDLAEMLHPMVENLSLEFGNTSLDVQLDAMCEVEVDAEMVKVVLRILVENARKYSPAGSPVEISCRRAGEITIVSVRDFGPGIPPDEQERIFEKYYRGRSRGETQGLGLGLAIARNIVHAHGGDLWVTSEPGCGAAFQFSLSSSGEAS